MEIRKREVLRYLGYRGNAPDERTEQLVDSCMEEVQRTASPVHVYRVFPVTVESADGMIQSGCFTTESRNLAKNLKDCEQILVFAATLGVGIDRLLAKYSRFQMSRAVVMQAASAALIEEYCNTLNEQWKRKFLEEGWYLRPRFSPGYGDFALENQREILQALDAAKWAGITLTDSLLMMPSKSVSAVIGMSRKPGNCVLDGCEVCKKTDCLYRRN
ncbi:MAG: vitamin B12 dependent-methionine synthase activation domain-containing protein [bacterium]|nr:vitamin B12 dependent-methionine synthase activation domain-containing protein [bacterium]